MHGGFLARSQEVGKSGYDLILAIAYFRHDFALNYKHLMGESFETFVPWSKDTTFNLIDEVVDNLR